MLRTNPLPHPTLYLFQVGRVKNMRHTLGLDNEENPNAFVLKYGYTKNLLRRTNEHTKTYGRLPNAHLRLKYHVYVPPPYLRVAEQDVEHFFKETGLYLPHKRYTELIVATPHELNTIVREIYAHIGIRYAISDSFAGQNKKQLYNSNSNNASNNNICKVF